MSVYRLFSLFLLICNVTRAFHVAIAGPGALEVQLIAAKQACAAGNVCTLLTGGVVKPKVCWKLMYGSEEDKSEGLLRFAQDGASMGAALDEANGLILTTDDKAQVTPEVATTLLDNCNDEKLKHVVLLSRMGGEASTIEDYLRKRFSGGGEMAALSIVRAGILKGGGPGEEPNEYGLSKAFYNTQIDLSVFMQTSSFDKYTQGAVVKAGSTPAANFFQKMSSKQSFAESEFDTGRTAVAGALLAALERTDSGVDVSVSCKAGTIPPTPAEWQEMLNSV